MICLMHKWVALMCFPRDDVRTVRVDELHILYAMVNKIKISHVQEMVRQWLGNFRMSGLVGVLLWSQELPQVRAC